MDAAQKALKASSAGVITNLDGRRAEPGLTPVDKKAIYSFQARSQRSGSNDLKAAQGAYEKALASGAATRRRNHRMEQSTLFRIAASTQQYQKAIDYGKVIVGKQHGERRDVLDHRPELLLIEGLQGLRHLGRQGHRVRAQGRRGPKGKSLPVQAAMRLGCRRYACDGCGLGDLIKLTDKTELLEHAAAHRAPG